MTGCVYSLCFDLRNRAAACSTYPEDREEDTEQCGLIDYSCNPVARGVAKSLTIERIRLQCSARRCMPRPNDGRGETHQSQMTPGGCSQSWTKPSSPIYPMPVYRTT